MQDEAIRAIEAVGINNRRIRSAYECPTLAQQGVLGTAEIGKELGASKRGYFLKLVSMVLLRDQPNWDRQQGEYGHGTDAHQC